MAHQVFISHSVDDAQQANLACERLEAAGFGCWIAPRNVRPGSEWAEAIMEAIEHASVIVVFLSRASNGSDFVQRELECATTLKKQILPIRIDATSLSSSLRFLLSSSHWMNASDGGVERHADAIVDAVRTMLAESSEGEGESQTSAGARRIALQDAGARAAAGTSMQGDDGSSRSHEHAGRRDPGRTQFIIGAAILLVAVGSVAYIARTWIEGVIHSALAASPPSPKAERPPAPDPTPAKTESERINSLGMKLVRIEPGKFRMGSPADEPFREDIERSFECTISEAFYIATTETTREQFAAFVKATGFVTDAERTGVSNRWTAASWEQRPGRSWRTVDEDAAPDHPVVDISVADALAFCDWLSKSDGGRYSLPSEAQWEYCYRCGTSEIWPWGSVPEAAEGWGNGADMTAKADEDGLVHYFRFRDGYAAAAPVGKFRANAWGIHDMFGNVREWCTDWFWEYPTTPTADPIGATPSRWRMARGSSFGNSPAASRSANRVRTPVAVASAQHIGFRVVWSPM